MNQTGKIIVITGTDGSGKETQTRKLYEYFLSKDQNVKMQSFPCYDSLSSGPVKMYLGGELSETADQIDAYQASALFAVDRFCTMKSHQEFLDNGGILLLDRYMESNYFHQVGKVDGEQNKQKFLDWLDDFEFNALKIPKPDLTLFLDMPPQKSIELARARGALKNGQTADIHERDSHHLETAYANGKMLAKKYGWPIVACTDGDRILTIEEIHQKCLLAINLHFKQKK